MARLQPAPPSSVPTAVASSADAVVRRVRVSLVRVVCTYSGRAQARLGVFARVCSDAQPTVDKMLEIDTPPPDPITKSIGIGVVAEVSEGGGGVPIQGAKEEVRVRTSRTVQTAMPRRMRLQGLWRRRCLTRQASGPSYH